MTEQLRESLSALMDDEANELEVQRLLGQLGEDEALRQTWVRYNLARSVISGQPVGRVNLDISQQVSAAIAADAKLSAGVWQRLTRPVASLAVAASVTAVVVLGGQQLYQAGDPDAGIAAPVAATGVSAVGFVNSLGAVPLRASYGNQAMPELEPAARTAYRELARQRMYLYMQEHAEHAALNSPQGLIPFARVPHIEE
ncbi:sigma-E factor negative regulatory protein [Haliea sp. E1-2-M8]|uniref:sigma-E factor negative regulatory protein n=1 Tax=Haliea sp. E1-2-M8 TaxID=3064706 RepID=UPI00271CDF3D|nr:sigma-E factor negative regulatory protein [Haliea sp. E1-2-M8]MDO8860762.1 sigma-E factor negative regulatory protein [Haliea sp. E1-2-M8]